MDGHFQQIKIWRAVQNKWLNVLNCSMIYCRGGVLIVKCSENEYNSVGIVNGIYLLLLFFYFNLNNLTLSNTFKVQKINQWVLRNGKGITKKWSKHGRYSGQSRG